MVVQESGSGRVKRPWGKIKNACYLSFSLPFTFQFGAQLLIEIPTIKPRRPFGREGYWRHIIEQRNQGGVDQLHAAESPRGWLFIRNPLVLPHGGLAG